jgi:hypothetical protein
MSRSLAANGWGLVASGRLAPLNSHPDIPITIGNRDARLKQHRYPPIRS